jgi:hypothetical protein
MTQTFNEWLHEKEEIATIMRGSEWSPWHTGTPPAVAEQRSGPNSAFFWAGENDSYYRRQPRPHCKLDPLGRERRDAQTSEERLSYLLGYEYNERHGDKKEWT